MKVFTVGLDQKPAAVEEGKQKSDSPPPGYSTTEARIPLPLGPELPRPPMPPQPIIVRKSRGYKGILLVMLSVFLMAIFALILSEMAYNRQRDENFFKLRWAELKHRMGYENDGPFEYYQRASAAIGDKFDRLLNLAKSNELASAVPQPLSAIEEEPASTSTSSPPPPSPEPVVAIDSFPLPIAPGVPQLSGSSSASSGSSSRSSSSQASLEVEPPQPIFNTAGFGTALNQIRDARLQFLRNILQKIKQHAEDIGFDGTMQVSIIEVEPQDGNDDNANGNNNNNDGNGIGANWPQRQLVQQQTAAGQFPPPHFFPNARPLVEDFKNSRSFLDGFGEFHQPHFVQNNQLGNDQEERPRMFGPWMPQTHDFPALPLPAMMQQQQQSQNTPNFMDNTMRWARVNPPFRQPEMLFFHPIFPQQMSLRFPPPIAPSSSDWTQQQQQQQPLAQTPQQNAGVSPLMGALPRPSAFDRWNAAAGQPQQQGMLLPGEQQQQQQPPQPQPVPPQQQMQIDFPEVKPPPAVVSGDSSSEDKFPVAPPNQPQPPPQQQPQPAMQLPKWLFENMGSSAAGPPSSGPAQQPPPQQQPAEMVKFPSVTVLGAEQQQQQQQPSRIIGIADNEGNRAAAGGEMEPVAVNVGKAVADEKMDAVESSSSQPEEVVEVDAAPQQSEQDKERDGGKENNKEAVAKEQQQQQQPSDGPLPQRLQPAVMPAPKWFPEVPSVFFQVDDPNEQQLPPVHAQPQQQEHPQQTEQN